MDAGRDGGARDAGGTDAATDAAPSDAAPSDGAAADATMPCPDPTGTYAVSAILAGTCGAAVAGYGATVTAGTETCAFAIASTTTGQPAADGSFVMDTSGSLVGASSSIDVGGQGAMLCNGSLSGSTLTFVCGSCTIQLNR